MLPLQMLYFEDLSVGMTAIAQIPTFDEARSFQYQDVDCAINDCAAGTSSLRQLPTGSDSSRHQFHLASVLRVC